MELGHGVADVFVARVAEQFELGPVGPQDRAVRADPVQALGGVFHEVHELRLAPAQRALGLLAPRHFGLERACLLLPERHEALLAGGVGDLGQDFAGAHVVVRAADVPEGAFVLGCGKERGRVGAEQREGMPLAEAVPQRFEVDRRVVLSVGAQQRDHLAEGVYRAAAGAGLLDRLADDVHEPLLVRPALDEQPGERLARIQHDEIAGIPRAAAGSRAEAGEPPLKLFQVLGGRDDDAHAAGPQRRVDELGDFGQEIGLVVVEPDEVAPRIDARTRRQRCDLLQRLLPAQQATRQIRPFSGLPASRARGACNGRAVPGDGLPGGTRTPDLLLRRQLLYPVELRAARPRDPWIWI